jgi:hypothetical protein
MLQKKGETQSAYLETIRQDIAKNQDRLQTYGIYTVAFTYPFGFFTDMSDSLLRELGYTASLSCMEGVNYLGRESSLFDLQRFNRPHGPSPEAFFRGILTP